MESRRHKCKLCFRAFPNGRALGGHMKSHSFLHSTFPLPPPRRNQLGHDPDATESSSSSSSYSSSEDETELKLQSIVKSDDVVYGLRENPRKSFRVADPEFSFAGSSSALVQDRGSECAESRNPATRRRSKRKFRKPWANSDSPVSSVSSDAADEDVAMCLVMLSRDVNNWRMMKKQRFDNNVDDVGFDNLKKNDEEINEEEEEEVHEMRGICGKKKLKCEKCMKQFRSPKALISHRRICSLNNNKGNHHHLRKLISDEERIFQCPYCFKVFGSGQALGGHKRSHLSSRTGSYPSAVDPPPPSPSPPPSCSLWDLNLPAAVEEDDEEFSVVSDA